ncbi:MAG: hypothetical protein ACOC4C_05820 [Fibrobacterota bacterium]
MLPAEDQRLITILLVSQRPGRGWSPPVAKQAGFVYPHPRYVCGKTPGEAKNGV